MGINWIKCKPVDLLSVCPDQSLCGLVLAFKKHISVQHGGVWVLSSVDTCCLQLHSPCSPKGGCEPICSEREDSSNCVTSKLFTSGHYHVYGYLGKKRKGEVVECILLSLEFFAPSLANAALKPR